MCIYIFIFFLNIKFTIFWGSVLFFLFSSSPSFVVFFQAAKLFLFISCAPVLFLSLFMFLSAFFDAFAWFCFAPSPAFSILCSVSFILVSCCIEYQSFCVLYTVCVVYCMLYIAYTLYAKSYMHIPSTIYLIYHLLYMLHTIYYKLLVS